jgi:hypothetical protein
MTGDTSMVKKCTQKMTVTTPCQWSLTLTVAVATKIAVRQLQIAPVFRAELQIRFNGTAQRR